jgi:hypothetical protein
MCNKILNAIKYQPSEEIKWYCNTKKEIHSNTKQYLQCKNCISEIEKLEYEAMKRLEWFLDGYFIHNLGKSFSKIPTEDICKIYNIKITYFRPWI